MCAVAGLAAGRLQSDSLFGSIPTRTSAGGSVTNSDTVARPVSTLLYTRLIFNASIAQGLEHSLPKASVEGSNLSRSTRVLKNGTFGKSKVIT